MSKASRIISLLLLGFLFTPTVKGAAQTPGSGEWLCDSSIEDCRQPLLDLIRNEAIGIDVGFWFMEDARFANALIARHNAGVRVRVLIDTKANDPYPGNITMTNMLRDAGIPMRRMTSSYLHWKMMLFAGQNVVEFGSANYSPHAFVPQEPLVDFIDETVYFSNDADVVNSFKTKFDDAWVSTSRFTNYANVTTPLTRAYPVYPIDPELSFPTTSDFGSRSVQRYNAEQPGTGGIDSIIYRITDQRHTDAIIAAFQRGVPVRIITEPNQYREPARYLHSWNVDRLFAAGIPVRHRRHLGSNHQKLTLLRGQRMSIFGSQNWTTISGNAQYEHNYFTTKQWIYDWFTDQFARKWNSDTETEPFVPLPPDAPSYRAPSTGALLSTTDVTLRWYAGLWAHKYDIYFGTSSNPPLLASDVMLGPSASSTDYVEYAITGLAQDTTYYWKVVSKTMANVERAGTVWNFRVGQAPAPGTGDVVLWATRATTLNGAFTRTTDTSAAGGSRIGTAEGGVRVTSPLATPTDYFDMTFNAEAGVPYRLWIRGKAQSNSWANDSVFVQFDHSATSAGAPTWRIGSTSATTVTIEDCTSCGLTNWGWNDNATNGTAGALGTLVYFDTSGPQTVRIQMREDGLSIDQIVLSRSTFLSAAPGTTKNDGTILPEQGGTSGGGDNPPPPTAAEIVLRASNAALTGVWTLVDDSTAANGRAMVMPDANRATIGTAYSRPNSYVEFTFNAVANRDYRLWIRGKATNDGATNDSVHVQFDNSVDTGGDAIWRIATSSSTEVNLEPCTGCGLMGWGWQDNGWGTPTTLGQTVRFGTTGPQRLRIQTREDGFMIDQIVLSPTRYITNPPGPDRNDNTFLNDDGSPGGGGNTPPPPTATEIVLHTTSAVNTGVWTTADDATAASGRAIVMPDANRAKITTPLANPSSYTELTFNAVANTPYRLWIRGRALNDLAVNDSVHIQFDNSVNASGTAVFRIGTATSTEVNLEPCSGCGLSGWGWQDNGWGSATTLGPEIRFATTGPQRIRIQGREDGFFIDQIVLSPSLYRTTPPGPDRNDTTILTATQP
jgi:phosphatidylserine/phosphatidylglycerophosphate/cardiolipin synthase-like enzyme